MNGIALICLEKIEYYLIYRYREVWSVNINYY